MSETDKPGGGVILSSGFGMGAAPSAVAAAPKHRILVIGDFGGRCDGVAVPVELADLAGLPQRLGVRLTFTVPDHLGSRPALGVDLAISGLRELDPQRAAQAVPEIARAEALIAKGGAEGDGDEALTRLAAALRREPAPSPREPAQPDSTQASSPTGDDDGSIDRLLGMIDAPAAATPATDPAKAAVSAMIGAMGSRSTTPAKAAAPAATALLDRQKRDIFSSDRWLEVEAAWRGLRALMSSTERSQAVEVVLCEISRSALPSALDALVTDESASGHLRSPLAAILVAGRFGTAAPDLDALRSLAAAGDAIDVPVIVSLDDDFFGVPPLALAERDSPATLLESAVHDAWRGLRARGDRLCAVWNSPLLRAETPVAPGLYGEPALLVGAIVIRSIVATDWPGAIEGPAAAVGGLDVAELVVGTKRIAAPLRAVLNVQQTRQLAEAGITTLMCRPDRDSAFLATSAMVGGGQMPTGPEGQQGQLRLATALVHTRLARLLQDKLPELVAGRSLGEAAQLSSAWLNSQLYRTGDGARASVQPSAEGNGLDIELRFGRDVLAGASIALSVDL